VGAALAALRHPLTRIVLLALCLLALFHWAHRFRYTLYDL
jgi:fumarate reductase subunit D